MSEDDIVFCQIGSLIHRKGCDILIHAFALLQVTFPRSKLLFIGDGPDYCRLVELVKKNLLDGQVFFIGNTENVEYYLQNCVDINVLASRSEAFGMVLLEASAASVPSVASDCGGIPEIIYHRYNGLLFKAGNQIDLSKQMAFFCDNKDLIASYGKNARYFVENNFSLNSFRRNIEYEIESTVADH